MRRIAFFGSLDEHFSRPFFEHLKGMSNVEIVKENAEVAVVASYGKLFSSKMINSFPFGMINVHPSLLPKYRGAAPAEWQILNGETMGGISVMKLVKKMDSGPLLCQKEFDISNLTRNQLLRKASSEGVHMLEKVVNSWNFDNCVDQNDELASYAPKVTRELTRIDWKNWKLKEFDVHMRAFGERFGGLETTYRGRKLKICKVEFDAKEIECEGENGTLYFDASKRTIYVKLEDGWLKCLQFQFENRGKPINDEDLERGYLHKHKFNKFE